MRPPLGDLVKLLVSIAAAILLGALLAWVEIRHPRLGPWPGFLVETGGVFGVLVKVFYRARGSVWFWVTWGVLLLIHCAVLGNVVSSAKEWRTIWFLEVGIVEVMALAFLLGCVELLVNRLRRRGGRKSLRFGGSER